MADPTAAAEQVAPEAPQSAAPGGQIDFLLDASVEVTVRMGHAQMKVRDLLRLAPGSVMTLDKRVGQPLDLMLRGRRFAAGELVVVDDQLGIRVTEICNAE